MSLADVIQGMPLKDVVDVIAPYLITALKTFLGKEKMTESAVQEAFPQKTVMGLSNIVISSEGLRRFAVENRQGIALSSVSDVRARRIHTYGLRLTRFMQGASPRLVLIGGLAQASLFAGGLGHLGLEGLDEAQKLQVYLTAALKAKQLQGASEEDIQRAETALGAAFKAESDPRLFEAILTGMAQEIDKRVYSAGFKF